MPGVELLAAGGPVVLLLGWREMRAQERRRRMAAGVRDALHELRRPLQALALVSDQDAAACQLELVSFALADLERAALGRPPNLRPRPLPLRPLVQAAIQRWQVQAPGAGEGGTEAEGDVELRWLAGDARAVVDPRRLGQAIDNLIANAIEHGRSPVRVEATTCSAGLRLSVRNRVERDARSPTRIIGEPAGRRGHGLRIVSAIAAAHGGRFLFDCTRGWAVGTLELPLSGAIPEAAAVS